ncbi:MAG: hypothetical protein HYX84_03835 [Chloroflexi bacterium]|nr:hypothetical protein [Chloroflexota bacterium]
MKTKFTKIMGVGLVISMLASLLVFATPASAADLSWSKQDIPSSSGQKVVSFNINLIAASPDGTTLFATKAAAGGTATEEGAVYRSSNGGLTWSASTDNLSAAATAIAVSPTYATDKTVYAAAPVGGASALFKSNDGGVKFTQITAAAGVGGGVVLATETIVSISVSPNHAVDGLVVAATADSASGTGGNVYQLGKPLTFGLKPVSTTNPLRNFWAVAFSPNYGSDRTIVAVGSNGTDTRVLMNINWESAWGATVGSAANVKTAAAVDIATLTGASLALPSDFNGLDTSARIVYVSALSAAADDTVNRVSGSSRSTGFEGPDAVEVATLAYSGTISAGTLFAGRTSARVDRVANPTSTTKSDAWSASTSGTITGSGPTQVAVAPDFATSSKVYAGTTGDDGAFNVSTSGGARFAQYGLVRTSAPTVRDITPSPAYGTDKNLFLVTTNATGTSTTNTASLWKSTDGGAGWIRVLALGLTATGNDALVRLSPNYATDKTVIFAERGVGTAIRKSTNAGESWSTVLNPAAVNDILVEDTNTFYIATTDTTNGVLKNIGGAYWTVTPTYSSSLNAAPFSLTQAKNGDILMGTVNGRVYLSTDRGLSYKTQPSTTITGIGGGNVRVAFDANYATNKTIYAASDVAHGTEAALGGNIQRLVVGTSTEWEAIDSVNTNPVVGLVVAGDGTLYAADSDNSSAVRRSLAPTSKTSGGRGFATIDTGLVTSSNPTNTFASLAVVSGTTSNQLFAIETTPATDRVVIFTDTFLAGPALKTPEVTSKVPVPQVAKPTEVVLTWTAITVPEGITPKYQVSVNDKSDFSGDTTGITFFPVGADVSGTGTDKVAVTVSGLKGGTQYYWRVKAITPITTRNSVTWTFITPFAAPAPTIDFIVPAPGAINTSVNPNFTWPSIANATYEFQIGEDPTFAILLYAANVPINTHAARETLAYNTNYYWRVRAISATAKSDWTTGIFTTMERPVPPTPPVTITPTPPATPPEIVRVEVPVPIPQPIPSYLLWAVIIIGGVLIVAVIILIVRTRRVS